MRYTSTRNDSIDSSFEEAICSGYAPDGGLFVPLTLPPITPSDLESWSHLSYPLLASAILRRFISIDELSDDDLTRICQTSYRNFSDPSNAVIVKRIGNIFLSELFLGPTHCFKDLGMQFVINLLSHFCSLRSRKMTLVVSTTGDTGPAAVRAVSDAENPLLSILVHYPDQQISAFQRKQLTTVRSSQVHVVAFEGGGDDMDLPLKRMMTKRVNGEEEDVGVCGVNSYNIGRPLMQMVHYVWTYLRVMEYLQLPPGHPDQKIDIVIPTGAMGNIAGGYMAKKMGLPIGSLCAAVNINDITHRVIQTGQFHKSKVMERTLSEAINIQVPYNFERLFYYLTDQNHTLIRDSMTVMESTRQMDLPDEYRTRLRHEFQSARITDERMCCAMKNFKEMFGYLADPHTSVAIAAAEELGYGVTVSSRDDKNPVAILATASPCKFEEVVKQVIGEEGWERYVKEEFPPEAKVVLEMEEVQPTIYRRREGMTLEQDQVEWERCAWEIIRNRFGGL